MEIRSIVGRNSYDKRRRDPPSRCLQTSSFYRCCQRNMKKLFLMFACCCLHIVLNCSLYLSPCLHAFLSDEQIFFTRNFIDLHIFTAPFFFSHDILTLLAGPFIELLMGSSIVICQKNLRCCKAIHHCS